MTKDEGWKDEGCYVFPLYFLGILRLKDWAQQNIEYFIYLDIEKNGADFSIVYKLLGKAELVNRFGT
jgi:hypothetical protein